MNKPIIKEFLLYVVPMVFLTLYIIAMCCIEVAYCDELSENHEDATQVNSEPIAEQPQEQPQESTQTQAPVTSTEQPQEQKNENNEDKSESVFIDYSDKLNSIKDNVRDINEVISDVQDSFNDKKDNDYDFEVTMVGIVGSMADNVECTVSGIDDIKRIFEDKALSENSVQVTLSANDFEDIRLLINDDNIIKAISENQSSYISGISENGRLLSVNSILLTELIKTQTETNNLLYALGISMIFVIGIQLGEIIIRSLPRG